jgi:hypothetical protein
MHFLQISSEGSSTRKFLLPSTFWKEALGSSHVKVGKCDGFLLLGDVYSGRGENLVGPVWANSTGEQLGSGVVRWCRDHM